MKRRARVVPAIVVIRCTVGAGLRQEGAAAGAAAPGARAAVRDFAAERIGTTVTVRFTVPAANQDGSRPPAAIERVDLYAVALAAIGAGADRRPARGAGQRRRRRSRAADQDADATAAADDGRSGRQPRPYTDTVSLPADGAPARAVLRRGRTGPAGGAVRSPRCCRCPLGTGPAAPSAVTPVTTTRTRSRCRGRRPARASGSSWIACRPGATPSPRHA